MQSKNLNGGSREGFAPYDYVELTEPLELVGETLPAGRVGRVVRTETGLAMVMNDGSSVKPELPIPASVRKLQPIATLI